MLQEQGNWKLETRTCLALLRSSRKGFEFGAASGEVCRTLRQAQGRLYGALRYLFIKFPGLTPWANLWRASGACQVECERFTCRFAILERMSTEPTCLINEWSCKGRVSSGAKARFFLPLNVGAPRGSG